MSDFFDIFASCCGERNPKKVQSASLRKVGKDKNKDHEAPFLETPRVEVNEKDSLAKSLPVESPRELLLFESSLSNLELLISNLLKSPPSSSPTSPPRARTPNPNPSPSSKPRNTSIGEWSDLLCFEILPLQ